VVKSRVPRVARNGPAAHDRSSSVPQFQASILRSAGIGPVRRHSAGSIPSAEAALGAGGGPKARRS